MSQEEFNNTIARAVANGYAVDSQTDTTAALTKRPKFSWGFFILWLILFPFIGGIIYVIYWMVKTPDTMFIEHTVDGSVKTTRG